MTKSQLKQENAALRSALKEIAQMDFHIPDCFNNDLAVEYMVSFSRVQSIAKYALINCSADSTADLSAQNL